MFQTVKQLFTKQWFYWLILINFNLVVYTQAVHTDFLTWDDGEQVPQNSQVVNFPPDSWRQFFSTYTTAMYQPLTTLSYALEYKLVGESTWLYHLDNIFLHLLNVFLVYCLSLQVLKNKRSALITAALFSLWPTQVEPVVWISTRSTLMASGLMLAGLLTYLNFIRHQKWLWFWPTLLIYILALGVKSVAICLPLLLIIADLWQQQSFKIKHWLKYLPFFIVALIFGLIAIQARQSVGTTTFSNYDWPSRLILIAYTYLWQLKLVVWPWHLSAFYSHNNFGAQLPWTTWLATSLIPLGLIWLSIKNNRKLWLLLAWFSANIIFSIQLAPYIATAGADRYNYLASLTLFWPLAYWLNQTTRRNLLKLTIVVIVGFCLFSSTAKQLASWSSETELWQQAINENPTENNLYRFLAYIYQTNNQPILALTASNMATALGPAKSEDYNLQGVINHQFKLYRQAIKDYNQAIFLDPSDSKLFYNRGLTLLSINKTDYACNDFHVAIIKLKDSDAASKADYYYQYGACLLILKNTAGCKAIKTANALGHPAEKNNPITTANFTQLCSKK